MKRLTILALCLLMLLGGCAAPREPGYTGESGALPAISAPEAAFPEGEPQVLPEAAPDPLPAAEPETHKPEPDSPEDLPGERSDPKPQAPAESRDPIPEAPAVERPKICIDPGHYAGVNATPAGVDYPYVEGDFDLQIALHLQRILLEKYGIEACMTRSTGTITLGGYTDLALDQGHLELRGAYAAEQGCDFFISIHTNANLNDANGAPTYEQPLEITKTVVLANTLCCSSDRWLSVANSIGTHVTAASLELGISDGRPFLEAAPGAVPTWSDGWNDSLIQPGAVLCRLGEKGDYYGVLRGAAQAGIPGVIVEHGFHTVPEMRRLAAEGDLAERWAEADADGIAAALGIPPLKAD